MLTWASTCHQFSSKERFFKDEFMNNKLLVKFEGEWLCGLLIGKCGWKRWEK